MHVVGCLRLSLPSFRFHQPSPRDHLPCMAQVRCRAAFRACIPKFWSIITCSQSASMSSIQSQFHLTHDLKDLPRGTGLCNPLFPYISNSPRLFKPRRGSNQFCIHKMEWWHTLYGGLSPICYRHCSEHVVVCLGSLPCCVADI